MAERAVEGSFNYVPARAERRSVHAYAPPEPAGERAQRPQRHTLQVVDARSLEEPLSLDVQGVVLERLDSAVSDFYDPGEVRAVYYPEVERLVRERTGAARVHVFDHNVRNSERAKRGEPGVSGPVRFAHNDYTVRSGPQRVRELLPEEADELIARRFAVINVWKPISGPVLENPLAVCDARSIEQSQLVPTDLRYADRTGEVYSLRFAPEHRWLFFPEMRADEAMLLKCYDSADDGRARFTCHAAFHDPSSPPDAPPRESVEVRALAFF